MSTIVEDIHDALEAQLVITLGSTFQKMRRVYSPEANDKRTMKKSFGVIELAASDALSVLKVYTFDHGFEILLADVYVDRADDDTKKDVVHELYDKASDVLKEILNSKLGLPTQILNIEQPSMSEPEILSNSAILIRVGIVIKYREALNS